MVAASLIISIVAIAISILTLWKTHFAPFSALAVAGRLTFRIYPIRNDDLRWFIGSLDVPVSVTNEGALPGVITGLRLRLHFPKIPIPGNCEFVGPIFEIQPENAKYIDKNRFEWTDKIVVGDWMPFTVLPKETVTKHFIFENRWEEPVIQEEISCTLEIRSNSGLWREVTSWRLLLAATMWSEHVDNGTAMSYYPAGHDFIHDDCVPPDLHKYTGTKSEIPKGGFGGHSSYLDYPEGDAPESSGEGG